MPIEVQVFTFDYVIRGFIETDGERLTDVLNLKHEPGLPLNDVQAANMYTLGKTPPVRAAKVRVEKRSILLAIPIERDLTHKSMFRKASRQGFEVVVLLPLFEVHGTIHLVERFDVRKGFTARPDDFIPLTDVSVMYALNPQLVLRAEAVIFNKNHVSMFGEARLLRSVNPPTVPGTPRSGG